MQFGVRVKHVVQLLSSVEHDRDISGKLDSGSQVSIDFKAWLSES